MDKREYQEKLQEINRLIADEDYEGAARIADSIDWKRVRNVQTLVMVSEVYEALERYEDSKVLLLRAYRRSPVGRTVLYRLVECCIKLRQFDQAIEYYSEYVQAAPHDNNKYILKYKIYRGRGASLDEQIDILKEYLDQEYNEKWAYELARLQIQAERVQEGLATCDDLVLWFHSGKYVIKALELKKKYAPLTPKQQEIYDNRFEEEDNEPEIRPESYLSEAASLAKAERAAAAQEEIKTELAADISHTAQMEATKAELSRKAEEAQAEVDRKAAESRKALTEKAREAAEEVPAPESAVKESAAEAPAEESAAKEIAPEEAPAEESAAEEGVTEEAPAEESAAEESVTEEASAEESAAKEPEAEEAPESISPEQMQADMIRSMREIVSGVGPKEQLEEEEAVLEEAIDQSKEDQEDAVAARGSDITFRVPASEASQKRQAGRLTIDDILLSMGDRGDHVRQVTGGSVMSATEEAEITAQHQAEAKAAAYDGSTFSDKPQTQEDPEIPRFLREEVREAKQTSEIPAAQIAEADDALRAQIGLESRDEAARQDSAAAEEIRTDSAPAEEIMTDGAAKEEKAQTAAPEPEEDEAKAAAAFMSAPRVPYTKEIAEAKTRRLPVDEIRKLHEAYLAESAAAAEEAAKNASKAAEIAAQMAEAEGALIQEEASETPSMTQREGEPVPQESEPVSQEEEKAPALEQTAEAETAWGMEEASAKEGAAASLPGGAVKEQVTREVPKSQPEPQIFTGRQQLKEYQKDLFRGFTTIGNLPEQIAAAIWQAENRKDNRTSRTGNILILGAHGCGKTTIATGIAKAIAEDTGTHSVKMARIYAADLNRKDIAATIAKIAGGVLIVEEAGDLDDAIVDQLTTAMEFRTDGMIMILEDEQRYIHDLLMRHPRFTMKFTAQIYIPEYTGEDLVNFGQIYANSKDYVLSEKAAEACLDKVESAKKAGDAVSVTNVIELVDRAIKNANGFLRRLGSAKKRYDSEDRIILREKDFR